MRKMHDPAMSGEYGMPPKAKKKKAVTTNRKRRGGKAPKLPGGRY